MAWWDIAGNAVGKTWNNAGGFVGDVFGGRDIPSSAWNRAKDTWGGANTGGIQDMLYHGHKGLGFIGDPLGLDQLWERQLGYGQQGDPFAGVQDVDVQRENYLNMLGIGGGNPALDAGMNATDQEYLRQLQQAQAMYDQLNAPLDAGNPEVARLMALAGGQADQAARARGISGPMSVNRTQQTTVNSLIPFQMQRRQQALAALGQLGNLNAARGEFGLGRGRLGVDRDQLGLERMRTAEDMFRYDYEDQLDEQMMEYDRIAQKEAGPMSNLLGVAGGIVGGYAGGPQGAQAGAQGGYQLGQMSAAQNRPRAPRRRRR